MKDCTILVNSCDLYEDAWEPFFELLKIQWPDCPCDLVLNSETKMYKGIDKNIKTILCEEKCTWSERYIKALKQVDTPYVLFILEDYFLLNKVNSFVFNEAIKVMNSNPNVGMICLSHTDRENISTEAYKDDRFYSRVINEKCMIWCRICLYRRDYLLELLREHETIWEFEKYASFRAEKMDYIILQQNNNEAETFTFKVKIEEGYGITLRKWLPRNVELFEKYGIQVNYDGLGIYSPDETPVNNKTNDSNMLREKLYVVKHAIKVFKKKLDKEKRKKMSLK